VSSQKIFLFDFDGVIVDGMQEYWHSSLLACERYLNSPTSLLIKNFIKEYQILSKKLGLGLNMVGK